MKKAILSAILIGWFFTISSPLPDYPGAKTVTRDGPFASEMDCNDYRLMLIDVFEQFGVKARFDVCVEEKAA